MSHVRLLVSVRNGDEAEAAIHGGADIIDGKEPSHGALGAVDTIALQGIANAMNALESQHGSKPLSLARGELITAATRSGATGGLPASASDIDSPSTGVHTIQFQKFGLANAIAHDWRSLAKKRADELNESELILVAYADFERIDAPDPRDVCAWVIDQPGIGLLIDTAVKDGASLFHWFDDVTLSQMIADARQHQTTIALAGSLAGDDFERAVALQPDIVGVRGAACDAANRIFNVSAARVRQLAQLIATHNAHQQTPVLRAAD